MLLDFSDRTRVGISNLISCCALNIVLTYELIPGYGNIAPKTNWGRIVTMVYAIFGMPLFLMWASQMGTFLAQSFQFIYANLCCVMCRRGKRRRAAIAASKMRKQELAVAAAAAASATAAGGLIPNIPPAGASATSTLTLTQPIIKGHSSSHLSLENEKKSPHMSLPSVASGGQASGVAGPSSSAGGTGDSKSAYFGSSRAAAKHLEAKTMGLGSGDSGLYSQLSLDNKHSSVGLAKSMEILEPGVKELLSTCAKYNIDQDLSLIHI